MSLSKYSFRRLFLAALTIFGISSYADTTHDLLALRGLFEQMAEAPVQIKSRANGCNVVLLLGSGSRERYLSDLVYDRILRPGDPISNARGFLAEDSRRLLGYLVDANLPNLAARIESSPQSKSLLEKVVASSSAATNNLFDARFTVALFSYLTKGAGDTDPDAAASFIAYVARSGSRSQKEFLTVVLDNFGGRSSRFLSETGLSPVPEEMGFFQARRFQARITSVAKSLDLVSRLMNESGYNDFDTLIILSVRSAESSEVFSKLKSIGRRLERSIPFSPGSIGISTFNRLAEHRQEAAREELKALLASISTDN